MDAKKVLETRVKEISLEPYVIKVYNPNGRCIKQIRSPYPVNGELIRYWAKRGRLAEFKAKYGTLAVLLVKEEVKGTWTV